MFEKGAPLPRHRAITQKPVHFGCLSYTDGYDKEYRRSIYTAYLRDVETGQDVLPPLRDAVVRWMGDWKISVSGTETDETSHKCTAQSWAGKMVIGDDDDDFLENLKLRRISGAK